MSDLRRYPRIHVSLEATLTGVSGEPVIAEVRNLSPGGVMIDCNPEVKEALCGGEEPRPGARPVEVEIRCRFPDQAQPFHGQCRLVYIRRLSQFEFNLGFRFIALTEGNAERLKQYVMQDFDPRPTSSGKATAAGGG